jgi:hypothetical protein
MIQTVYDGQPIDGGILDRVPRRVLDFRTEQVRRSNSIRAPEAA